MAASFPAKIVEQAEEVAAVSGVYRLLGRLWSREVDAPLLHELATPPMAQVFAEAGGKLPAKSDHQQVLTELATDYCQLLLGPQGHLPPYQSVWTEGQFHGKANASMQRYLEIVGVPLDAPIQPAMVESLGTQLEAMGRIAAEFGAIPVSEPARLRELAELAGCFFRDHLCWPTPLLAAASERAQTTFYRSVISMTVELLRIEHQRWVASVDS